MCGISGIATPGGNADARLARTIVEALAHRGPDSTGCEDLGSAVLAQQRLSILDPTPSGFQPMASADGRHWIVHNGEIYNFLELADELVAAGHTFRTETDTEVILAAYAEWGTACVERFNGIWAMALWDVERQRLFLSRDRLGVKPLFYAEHAGGIAFASEIKGLLALPDVSRDPEPGAIRDFLLDAMVDHSDRTFFRDVRRIPAAHNLVLSRDGSRTIERYWPRPPLSEDVGYARRPSDADQVEEFRALLVDSVALQLRSDVELGSCLSGGVDSSSIVTIAAGLRNGTMARQRAHAERDALPQHAFFAEFREPGIDEREYVDAVVARTGVELHTVTPTADDFFDALPSVMRHQDEPFGSASIVAQYFVMKLARETGVRVLLDGQGADELLAGYPRVRPARLLGAIRQRDLGTVARLAPGEAASVVRSSVRRPAYLASVLRRTGRAAARRVPFLEGRRGPGWVGERTRQAESLHIAEPVQRGTMLAAALWDEVARSSLPALLRYEDRNSMAFGIEARVPFLDHRIVELAMRLPDRLKIDGDRRKVALLDAMRGVVAPQVLARRDKIGFVPPQDRWLREVVGRWSDLRRSPLAEDAGFLRPGTVARTLERIGAGAPTGVPWRILNLELWLRQRAE
jgi:asparagine synthase (glutamine-hydrolysing)